ncbi:MAG: tetratricopeptide repeat protein [Bryobacterales bacterium]|nr:tetratricopeptide repeat protein [Bryobacterales bacterium]
MSQRSKVTNILSLLLVAAGIARCGQTAPAPAQNADRAAAYYHFSLGHLYSELAGAYGNKGDYLNKAIENYRLALKADPGATFLADELSDLYIQAGQTRTAVLEAEEAIRQNPDDLTARRILGRIYTRMIGDPQQRKINEDMVKRAIEQYRKVAEKEPADLDTWLMLGRLYKVAQNSVDAEKAYRKALELDPNNEDAMTGLAMVYADLGDNKSASEMLRKVADKSPGMRTLTALAGTYEQMREYALAAETLKKALEFSPGSNPELTRALAQNLMLAERYDEALKVYQDLIAEDPKDAQSQLRVSQIYRQKNDFAKAREASRKALEIDPDNLEARFNDVNLFEAEGKIAEALTLLKDMLGSTRKQSYSTGEKANRVALLERLGVMYRSNERPQEAVAAFREIGELDATLSPRVAAQVIETYRAAKDYAKAEREAEEAAKKHPDDRTLRMVRASVLAETGKPAQAVEELKTLLDGKSDREIQLSIAQAHEKAKNYPEMAKALDAAEKLSESNDERETVLFMRGAMYEKLKQWDAAETEFRKTLALNPGNASALNYLGYMLADRNVRLSEAQQLIQKALERDPNNGAYLDSLGWVYYRMGKLEEAEQTLRRALERFPRDPTIHDHLGDVCFRQGRLKDAIVQWQNSLKEWESASAAENDPAEVAKIQKKLEGARVRLAKEGSGNPVRQQQ